MKKIAYLHLLLKLTPIFSNYLYCMKRSRSICRYWSVVKIENEMLRAVCECGDLPVKILVDLKGQEGFLIVWWLKKKAASLVLLMAVWGRSLLCALSWWLIHCEICKWHSHGDTRCVPHKGYDTVPKGRVSPEATGGFSQSVGPQLTLTQRLGAPH